MDYVCGFWECQAAYAELVTTAPKRWKDQADTAKRQAKESLDLFYNNMENLGQ